MTLTVADVARPVVPATSRVAVWHGEQDVRVEYVTVPRVGPGEVLVRVRLATVCGSDRHTVRGVRPGAHPSVLGHEAVGDVVAVGAGGLRTPTGDEVRPGDRVVWGVTVACGTCDRCHAGRTAKCRHVRKIGHERVDPAWPLSGTYAEHVLLPAGATVAKVPVSLDDATVAPAGCATATVVAAAEAAGELRGQRVLVVGAGMLGLAATALAADAGAAQVLVTDVDPQRLRIARRFGATDFVLADEPVPTVDVVLELSGSTRAATRALGCLDVGGTLVLVGSVSPGPDLPVAPQQVVRNWWRIVGVHNYEPRHLVGALDLLERTSTTRDWGALVEPPVPLGEVGAVLTASTSTLPRVALDPSH